MGLISTIEKRGSVDDPNMWINTLLESANYSTKSGVNITADTALKISTVYACVTIISQTIASLPMSVNKKLPSGGNEEATDHPLHTILSDAFNAEQDSFQAREMGVGCLKLRGNWYNRIERNGSGQIVGIWPLNPAFMEVYRLGNSTWYKYDPGDSVDVLGNKRGIYSANEIWHVKGYSKDGLTGLSTIQYARESMGLAQALQDFSSEFFGNKAVPGNILEHPNQLSATSRKNLQDSIQAYASEKRHMTLVLEEGMKWQNVGITNVDAQYLEISGAQVRDIARWFHMPLILLQEPDKASTYASAEQFMLSFVVHTISPDVVRIEKAAKMALLTEKERQAGYYIKLNLKGLLRGDFKTRMDGYRVAREGGWFSVNDIRRLEDETPIENGDIYLQPLNYKEAGTEDPEPTPQDDGDKKKDDDNG